MAKQNHEDKTERLLEIAASLEDIGNRFMDISDRMLAEALQADIEDISIKLNAHVKRMNELDQQLQVLVRERSRFASNVSNFAEMSA